MRSVLKNYVKGFSKINLVQVGGGKHQVLGGALGQRITIYASSLVSIVPSQ